MLWTILVSNFSGRSKGQKLVGCFFEDRTFCRLLIAIPLKIYSKIGQLKWFLVSQMLKLARKWPTVIPSTVTLANFMVLWIEECLLSYHPFV